MKDKIKQTILSILSEKRSNGDVLPFATSIEVAHRLHMNAVEVEKIAKLLNAGISDSQLYKLAGNSIVVSCMEGIFYNAFCEDAKEPAFGQLSLF